MSTLLQSCQHHQRICTLSQRAREAQIYEDEYSEVLNDTGVVERQCTQRSQWDRERQNRVVEKLGSLGSVVPITASYSELDAKTHVSLLSVMTSLDYNKMNNRHSVV